MKRKTNVQIIKSLMEDNMVVQLFVMDAVQKMAYLVVQNGNTPERRAAMGNAIMDGETWVAAAEHIKKTIEENYKK